MTGLEKAIWTRLIILTITVILISCITIKIKHNETNTIKTGTRITR